MQACRVDGSSVSTTGWGMVIQVVNTVRRPMASGAAASSVRNGSNGGESSAASSSTVRSGSRKPTSAWNSVSAQISSGLWLESG